MPNRPRDKVPAPQTIEDLMCVHPYLDGHPDAGWVDLSDEHTADEQATTEEARDGR